MNHGISALLFGGFGGVKVYFAVTTASLGEQLALTPAYTASLQLLFCVVCSTGFYFCQRSCSRSALVFSRMSFCCKSVSKVPERPVLGLPRVRPFENMRTLLGLLA